MASKSLFLKSKALPKLTIGASARTGFPSAKPCTVPTSVVDWYIGKFSRLFFLLIVGLVSLFLATSYLYYHYQSQSRAAFEPALIDDQALTPASVFIKQSHLNFFSLFGKDKIYSLDSDEAHLGMVAFFNKDIQLKQTNQVATILPKSINQELFLVRKITENNDQSLHFFYQQRIDQLPVYGSFVQMHLKENGQFYGLQGSVIDDSQIPAALISEETAKAKAMEKANQEIKDGDLNIDRFEKLIFNKKILGIGSDDKNYLVLAVSISSQNLTKAPFAKKFFVDLETGEVIYEENLIDAALARYIYDYRTFSGNQVKLARGEGDPATGDADIDNGYDLLGEIYNYYLSKFDRKSYDNNDSPINSIVHINGSSCPNAWWNWGNNFLFVCDGMIAKDIMTHEFTHGVNNDLVYTYQSGALAESLSDILAVGLDDKNWTMGEDSILGVIRYLDDPTKATAYSHPQPDRLFSDYYRCSNTAESSNDYGDVHTNGGVVSKAFYLMVQGGEFNDCSIAGIGMTKALQIVYRYMTVYMTPTDNFKNVYDSMLQSCKDLFQEGSDTCVNVTKALRATELDQQPANEQKGALCLGVVKQKPVCDINLSLSPTTIPSGSVSPTEIVTVVPPISTPPTPTPELSCQATGSVVLDLKLRFQGVLKGSNPSLNGLKVFVNAVSHSGNKITGCGGFTADTSGLWLGKVYLNIPSEYLSEKYSLFIKGPKHLQKKVCDLSPSESLPGTYRCQVDKISLKEQVNNLDFSKITLLVGDLPLQDGITNSYDIALVTNNLSKTDPETLKKADLNLDGVVDTQDYSLVIAALSIRFDEQ